MVTIRAIERVALAVGVGSGSKSDTTEKEELGLKKIIANIFYRNSKNIYTKLQNWIATFNRVPNIT